MLTTPKTVPAEGTIGDLRALFANPHVMMALLVDGSRFAGVVHREQLDDALSDEQLARGLAEREVPTIEPDAPLADALAMLDSGDERRLVVLGPGDDELQGLLCLTSDRRGFCQS